MEPVIETVSSIFFLLLRWIKSFGIFWYVIFCNTYIMRPRQFKPLKVPTVVGRVMIYMVCDLKATNMNLQHNLI